MDREKGFSLIEISIVLVIIGLILGGVLKGQEMINNGKIKRAINDMNGTATAILTYQDNYRALPGDDRDADIRWAANGLDNNDDGNGNGVIDGNWNSTANTDESRALWLHLRNAGLIAGPTNDATPGAFDQPINAFGGIIGVMNGNYGLRSEVICLSKSPGKLAAIIDTQLDDGNPATGSVRSDAAPLSNAAPVTTTYDEQAIYNLCRTL